MNIQKVFKALKDDKRNSALGKICEELERQGYIVAVDGVQIASDEFFSGGYKELQEKHGPFEITLMMTTQMQKLKIEQTFCIEFTELNGLIIKQKQT